MSYYFSKKVNIPYNEAISRVTKELKKEGFGILTEIDVKETLKKKLDVDCHKYKILGACNPSYAYKSLQIEDKIGLMFPCNVVVQEIADGAVEVAAIDPVASMQAVENQTCNRRSNAYGLWMGNGVWWRIIHDSVLDPGDYRCCFSDQAGYARHKGRGKTRNCPRYPEEEIRTRRDKQRGV
jgi:uncharacterized protein (DUF302 family)